MCIYNSYLYSLIPFTSFYIYINFFLFTFLLYNLHYNGYICILYCFNKINDLFY